MQFSLKILAANNSHFRNRSSAPALEDGQGTCLMKLHEMAIADDVGCQDGGKAALDASFGHEAHRLRNSRHAKFYWSRMEESTAGD